MTNYVREKLKQRTLNESHDEAEDFGHKLAKSVGWDGVQILKICKAALIDANFHSEARKVSMVMQNALDRLNGKQ